MCNNFNPVALEVIILEQLVEVTVIIHFTNLHNCKALNYYAKSCTHNANHSLILNSVHVENNHANTSFPVFYFILHGCGFDFNSSGCYANKHHVLLTNSNIKGNKNVSKIISILLKQTLISSANITQL